MFVVKRQAEQPPTIKEPALSELKELRDKLDVILNTKSGNTKILNDLADLLNCEVSEVFVKVESTLDDLNSLAHMFAEIKDAESFFIDLYQKETGNYVEPEYKTFLLFLMSEYKSLNILFSAVKMRLTNIVLELGNILQAGKSMNDVDFKEYVRFRLKKLIDLVDDEWIKDAEIINEEINRLTVLLQKTQAESKVQQAHLSRLMELVNGKPNADLNGITEFVANVDMLRRKAALYDILKKQGLIKETAKSESIDITSKDAFYYTIKTDDLKY